MDNSYDFDSDHRLVIADMKTPSTKEARFRKRHKKTQSKKLGLTALQNENIATAFKEQTLYNLSTIDTEQDNTNINEILVKSINETADNVLPLKSKSKPYQPWHDDEKLKQLYQQKDENIIKFPNSNTEDKIASQISPK